MHRRETEVPNADFFDVNTSVEMANPGIDAWECLIIHVGFSPELPLGNNALNKDLNQPRDSKSISRESECESVSNIDEFETLMSRIKGGSSEAWHELVVSCRDYLLLIANQELDRNLNRKIGPSDIVQNTMLAAHNHVGEFQGQSREQFMAWIRQILLRDVNRARREFVGAAKRRATRETSITGDSRIGRSPIDIRDTCFTPQTAAIRSEEEKLLQKALMQLSVDDRQIIIMRNQEHLSFGDIGQQLDCSEDTAQKRWTRAIEKLKLKLKSLNAL